ncbi:hypothetical protein PPERSA_11276 [Pseudocohnilembus persalinus]|uniref:Uncharacterized protein n=1 Tax=Pseudocohnilembus persalinus TaxID=266149 RepID=A0A0V0QPX8_PSEPJ|nr:hypothetical protein PPERSA_11276 [Pseudocohnilembus persalinus]|eukprot:KRX04152.1 hypothetical protein PPERSA_11276 [Pseudocohnilembus persalinus]
MSTQQNSELGREFRQFLSILKDQLIVKEKHLIDDIINKNPGKYQQQSMFSISSMMNHLERKIEDLQNQVDIQDELEQQNRQDLQHQIEHKYDLMIGQLQNKMILILKQHESQEVDKKLIEFLNKSFTEICQSQTSSFNSQKNHNQYSKNVNEKRQTNFLQIKNKIMVEHEHNKLNIKLEQLNKEIIDKISNEFSQQIKDKDEQIEILKTKIDSFQQNYEQNEKYHEKIQEDLMQDKINLQRNIYQQIQDQQSSYQKEYSVSKIKNEMVKQGNPKLVILCCIRVLKYYQFTLISCFSPSK